MKISQEEIDAAREAYSNDGKYNWDRTIRAALTVRKRLKRERKAAKHPLNTAAALYQPKPVKLAGYLKDHYDVERGVFDFETPDGVYVFVKGKE